MTRYDFDTPVERHGTDSLKFDCAVSRHRSPNLLSLWVADMDFPLPEEITEPLAERVRHGIFGYTEPGDAYYEAVSAWFSSHYGWSAPKEWFSLTPGVVYALATAVKAFTEPGDAVLIQQPVYYPFSEVVEDNGRKLANAPLTYEHGTYRIDFDAFEACIDQNNVKMFLLCNPHNPVGRVWTPEELQHLADICLRHQVIIVSDEIHMDFARPASRTPRWPRWAKRCLQTRLSAPAPARPSTLRGCKQATSSFPTRSCVHGSTSRKPHRDTAS